MLAIAPTPLQLGNSIRKRRRELGLTQEQLAAKAGVRQRRFRILRGQRQPASTPCCVCLPRLTWNWWFGGAPRVHPKTLRDSSNAPANLARPSKSLSQQSTCRSRSMRDFGGDLFSIRRIMAGVEVCPARITLTASTRTGIPGRPVLAILRIYCQTTITSGVKSQGARARRRNRRL